MPPLKGATYTTDQSLLIASGRKQCGKCSEIKNLDQFYKVATRSNGYSSACKRCEAERAAARNGSGQGRAKNRARKLRTRYGISLDEYTGLLEAQRNRCAICAKEHTDKDPLRVDHSHITNQVRGLLCHSCNVALGLLKESPANLVRALAYMEGTPQ